jgi:hypothetical protein
MKLTHDGMTIAQRRLLQFWLDAHGWGDWYVELNGELPMPDDRWEDELDGQDRNDRPDMMPSVDALSTSRMASGLRSCASTDVMA